MKYFIQARALVFVQLTIEQAEILIKATKEHDDQEFIELSSSLEHKLRMGQLYGPAGFDIKDLGLLVKSIESTRQYEAIALYESLSTAYKNTVNFMPMLNERLERDTAKEV